MPNKNYQFGKVAVLMGGTSAEREISLKSGAAVLKALTENQIDAHAVDVGENVIQDLQSGNFDRVFNMLHGRIGEDGVIQGALEILGLPYTGSGVLASAISMNKLKTKQIWQANGLPTPDYFVANRETKLEEIDNPLNYPVIVKPLHEGSSIGMSKVTEQSALIPAINLAMQYDKEVLVEQWVHGEEYTASILGEKRLPLIKLQTPHDFYDYDAKYKSNTTHYICPCGLNKEKEMELQRLAYQAFLAVGANGWGRVDFMLDEQRNPQLIEINTLPGMTDHSLVPMAAKQAGISFNQLVIEILAGSLSS